MRIFRIIWGVYCFIVLAPIVIFTALFILTTNVIFGKRSRRINLILSQKISCVGICYLSGIFVKVIGKENFEPNKGYVIIGNHNSNYDIFINSITLPWENVFFFLSKVELGKVPVFSVVAKNLAVLVDRSSMTSRVKSMKKMKEILNDGISVWIFPEGTRNKTDEPLIDFIDGAFRLAVDMKSPIIVSTLVGMRHINNPNYKIDMAPGIVRCYFEKPIDTSPMTVADIPALKEQVRNLMLSRLTPNPNE
jgi:1-acyl-sn-glycerol-3-phosphate acyltransferase